MESSALTLDLVKTIEEILSRGNTAEVKRRKDDIIVLEVSKKIRKSSPQNGEGKK